MRALNNQPDRNMTFDANFKPNEIYERGAALLVTLAYPDPVDAEKNFQLYLSLCGNALWLKHIDNPDDRTPITVKSQYVFRDRKIIERDVRTIEKRVAERMVAARMAIAFLKRANGETDPCPRASNASPLMRWPSLFWMTRDKLRRPTSNAGTGRPAVAPAGTSPPGVPIGPTGAVGALSAKPPGNPI
jgi:hypothetical protein